MLKFPSGNLPSVMKSSHNFAQVPKADIQRSSFNRSHGYKTAFNSGYLIPVYVDEALPGDSFNMKMSCFARLSTPIVPFMDNLYLTSFFFAIPYRLVWSNFKKFCGEQAKITDSTNYTIPQFTAYNPTAESLSDYMGIPPLAGGATVVHSSLWHRAYNLIWNTHFRDQNLQDEVKVDLGDGPDAIADYVLLKRGKRHDYFTSCLPWTQKNNTGTAVAVGLAGTAPVLGIGKANQTFPLVGPTTVYESNEASRQYAGGSFIDVDTVNEYYYVEKNPDSNYPYIRADLSVASGITINSLRLAFQTQKMYERDARGERGTRKWCCPISAF